MIFAPGSEISVYFFGQAAKRSKADRVGQSLLVGELLPGERHNEHLFGTESC